jgi:hypothetical protein
MSITTETVADIISNGLDGEFHDGEGIFLDAMSSRNTVQLTVTDAETDERFEYILTVAVAA